MCKLVKNEAILLSVIPLSVVFDKPLGLDEYLYVPLMMFSPILHLK